MTELPRPERMKLLGGPPPVPSFGVPGPLEREAEHWLIAFGKRLKQFVSLYFWWNGLLELAQFLIQRLMSSWKAPALVLSVVLLLTLATDPEQALIDPESAEQSPRPPTPDMKPTIVRVFEGPIASPAPAPGAKSNVATAPQIQGNGAKATVAAVDKQKRPQASLEPKADEPPTQFAKESERALTRRDDAGFFPPAATSPRDQGSGDSVGLPGQGSGRGGSANGVGTGGEIGRKAADLGNYVSLLGCQGQLQTKEQIYYAVRRMGLGSVNSCAPAGVDITISSTSSVDAFDLGIRGSSTSVCRLARQILQCLTSQ